MTQPPGPDQSTGPAQPPVPGETGTGPVPPHAQQPGYPAYPGQAAPGEYGPALPQYSAGGYDPSQPYVLYQAPPTGGMFHGQVGDDDPLISPNYAGWWQRSVAIVKQGWRSLALLQGIGFLVSLLFSVPQALLVVRMTDELDRASKAADPDTGAPATPDLGPIFSVLGLTVAGAFLAIMVGFVVAIACNHVAVSVAAGLRPRLGAALALAMRRVFPLIGWQLLAGLIVLAGVCACILPAIYLSAVFMLLPVVVTFERGGSAISRCFKLFHRDLSSSISRIATIAGITIGIAVVAYFVSMIIQLAGGTPAFNPESSSPFGGVSTAYIVAVVIGTAAADLMARAGAVLTSPLTLAAYADLRARVEPLSTAALANEAGLAPTPQQPYSEGFAHPAQQHGPDSDWMPPNR